MKFEVTKELETGNAIIDSEHRELFAAVNRLMDACSAGHGRDHMMPMVNFLLDYVDKHFAHEEQLQNQSHYPGFFAHHAFHENYRQKLKDILSKISANGPTLIDVNALNLHIGTLVAHIKTEDKKLGTFLKGQSG